LIIDSDLDNWSYYPGGNFIWESNQTSQSFVGGETWTITTEPNYTQVHLGAFSDVNKNHSVNLNDLAKIGSAWLSTTCGRANNYCDGTDFWPLGSGDGKVDFNEIMQLADEWLQ
jgi:hypothetical protein